MRLVHYTPSLRLQPFVKTFLLIESEEGMVNDILPDTSLVLAFRLKGIVKDGEQVLPSSVISGLRNGARRLSYEQQSRNLLVIFNAGAAAAFFKLPLHEVYDTSIALDDVVDDKMLRIAEERIAEAKSAEECIAIVEEFLISRLDNKKTDVLIQHAIGEVYKSHGMLKIHTLTEQLHISKDAFEKRFRRVTGASAKKFARIVRLRSLVQQQPDQQSLTDLAYESGYFDQSHFIKDFRLFTGLAPNEFFKNKRFW